MDDIVERLLDRADAVPEWAKQPGHPDYMISISRREALEVVATIATLTRRVEELENAWQPITKHPDHPCDVMYYLAHAEWISAKTLEVEPGIPNRERYEIGYWEDGAWHYAGTNHEVFEFGVKPGDNLQAPTHWRPLPTPPQGGDHG